MKTSFLIFIVAAAVFASTSSALKLVNVVGANKADAYGADSAFGEEIARIPLKRSICPAGFRPQIYFGQVICY
ncbi:hypothetical protein QR680_014886 [Steinernema hermaphroditum]|uniref:Uncharacterized protein n=1 Tax=Steinernema hermaphroditum TaxID=289476 RepID=A0AA39M508_9BILA|nr:hypothetical protein QR680_014886 [Steinernema hermaphroditum]